jgi:hypothetical protein
MVFLIKISFPIFFNWLFLIPAQVHSYESELKVAISGSTVGKYICRASVKGFREVTASAEIFMKGPPRIFRKDPTQVRRESVV